MWSAWDWDAATAAWLGWLAWFIAFESWALWSPTPGDTLTAHLRPFIVQQSLTWCLAFGLWLWIGFHFLVEGVFLKATGNG